MQAVREAVLAGPGVVKLAQRLHCDPGSFSRVLRGEQKSPHILALAIQAMGMEREVYMQLQRDTEVLYRVIDRHNKGRATASELLAAIRKQQESARAAEAVAELQARDEQKARRFA